MPRESNSSPRRLEAKERQRKALELRKAGVSFAAIADAVGFHSPQAAFDSVERALKALRNEPAEELRKLDLARLDAMFQQVWPFMVAPTVRVTVVGHETVMQVWDDAKFLAIDRGLRILAHRARLLGIEATPELVPLQGQHLLPGQREIIWRVVYDSPPDGHLSVLVPADMSLSLQDGNTAQNGHDNKTS